MNTHTLSITAFLAALAAAVAFPVSVAASCVALTVTGTLAVLLADYGRTVEPLRVPAVIVPFNRPSLPDERLFEAA